MVRPVGVFVIGERELWRRGFQAVLENEPDIVYAGEAPTVVDATTLIDPSDVDVVIIDCDVPGGMALCRRLTHGQPPIACVLLASEPDERLLVAAFDAGASALLHARAGTVTVLKTVRAAAQGRSLLDPDIARFIGARVAGSGNDPVAHLTEQEQRIFELIAEGLSNREIAARVTLAEKTVKNYVSAVLRKFGMSRRAQLIAYAASSGSKVARSI